jgi:beta-galactosidase
MGLGGSANVAWATAQPVAFDAKARTHYFMPTAGIPVEFAFTGARVIVRGGGRVETRGDGYLRAVDLQPGSVLTVNGFTVAVISEADAGNLFLKPSPAAAAPVAVATELVRPAGPLRKIEMGKSKQPVAAMPVDADFAAAAVWRVKLPPGVDLSSDTILRLHYTGDVARVYLGGKFINDDYYNGQPLDIGLRRHAADLKNGELTIAILPLQKNAPIYLPDSAKPDFGSADSVVALMRAELVANTIVELSNP